MFGNFFVPFSDYGYKRDDDLKCVRDPTSATSQMDICIDNDEELIQTQVRKKAAVTYYR